MRKAMTTRRGPKLSPRSLARPVPNRMRPGIGRPVVRGSILGFLLGCFPPAGAMMASFPPSYMMERRSPRHPYRISARARLACFAAPRPPTKSGAQASFIPLLCLGIPPVPNPTNAVDRRASMGALANVLRCLTPDLLLIV